ncbi:hypothetical protein BX666DRAFT_2028518 [Dichotomocladium elegans]|nr:hypothetical protein BX666DRAFT_2028518 [Dichotomocladium elegans]
MSTLEGSALEEYLCQEVKNLCDAEPALVARYISALIGSGDPPNILRETLEGSLREFFGDRRFSDYSDEEDDGDRNFKHRRPRSGDREDSRLSRPVDDHYSRRRAGDGSHSYGEANRYSRGDDYRSGRMDGVPLGPAAMYNGSGQYDGRNRGARGGYRGDTGRSERPLCRDYNEKGFCMRGDMCPYDHGADRIVVDDGSFSSPFPPIAQQPPPFFGMPNTFDAYDPERATLMAPGPNINSFGIEMPGIMAPAEGMPNRMFSTPRGRGRGAGRGRGGRGGLGGPGGGFHQSRQNTTLVVENIPPEFCDISKVNEYFKKFGSITNISVQGRLSKATVQFSNNAEANAAYNSPDPIFDNRFVKVYWFKEEDQKNAGSVTSGGSSSNSGAPTPSSKPVVPQRRANEPDPEEVAARAAELAKEREEKQKRHQERMKAILEVQKQREQLLQKQITEQKRLMEKLSNQNMSQEEKKELLAALRNIQNDINTTRSDAAEDSRAGANTSSEDLRAKLVKVEAEAAALGIPVHGPSTRGRGGYYGSGWPRGRGGLTRYTLDNRPTRILVKDISSIEKDDVKKHFGQFGRITGFETVQEGVIIQYAQRFEAEKAMNGGANSPFGNLTLSWHVPSMQTAPISANDSGQPAESEATKA